MVITGVKMEEEVPRTLGYFGYPFNVAKSCLKSVGSPHAWPILIGVLIWLIDVSVCACMHWCVPPVQWSAHVTDNESHHMMNGICVMWCDVPIQFGVQSLDY